MRQDAEWSGLTPQLLTLAQAAELLRVSADLIHEWVSAGLIPFIELSRTSPTQSVRIPLQGLLSAPALDALSTDVDAIYAGCSRSR